MTSRTPRRHRRLAFMAAGTVAAMVLVPGTALAQDTTPYDFEELVQAVQELADPAGGAEVPALPGTPDVPGAPALPFDSDDDSDGHETEDPEFPDHGSGFVLDLTLEEGEDIIGDDEVLELARYDATVEDDGSTHSDASVISLLGDELTGSGSSSSDGSNESSENITEELCEGTGGLICLSLLYHDTSAFVDEDSFAFARAGVLALCLASEEEEDVTASYECDGLLGAGVAEGVGVAERDGKTGHSEARSFNEVLSACLAGQRNDFNDEGEGGDSGDEGDGGGDPGVRGNESRFACDGPLGVQALHSDTDAESETPDTQRRSWLLGIDSDGEEVFRLDDPQGLELLSDCGDELSIICLFLNQGESFIYENPQGAGSAQEALHLDLLQDTPLDILLEIGQSESIAHLESPPGCPPGEKGPCPTEPECKDRIDNDGDGKIDFPKDPGCDSPEDDSEKDEPECKDGIDNDGDKKIDFGEDPECDSPEDDSESNGKDGLADTGTDVAPLLAGAFLMIGMGALTVAATRRRIGKHSI